MELPQRPQSSGSLQIVLPAWNIAALHMRGGCLIVILRHLAE